MRHAATIVLVSLLSALPLSAQELPKVDDITALRSAVAAMQTRVYALERQLITLQAQVASQVGFTKSGNSYVLAIPGAAVSMRVDSLDIHTDTAVQVRSGTNLSMESGLSLALKGGSDAILQSAGTLNLRGSTMMLNNGARPALAYSAFVVCPAGGGPAPVQLQVPQATVLIP